MALFHEEGRNPADEGVVKCQQTDRDNNRDNRAAEQGGAKQVPKGIARCDPARPGRPGAFIEHRRLCLSLAHDYLCLGNTALAGEPAWRLRQGPAQEPDDKRPNGDNHEHPSPTEPRNDHPADQCGQEQAGVDDQVEQRCEAAAMPGRNEFAERAVTNHDFCAKPDAHYEPRRDQPCHRGRHSAGQRGNAEDHQVELIGKLATEPVAQDACEPGADHHAQEGRRDEHGIQLQRRFTRLNERTEHAAGEV
ncbi:hypothetical protein GALL_490530 [mine drainage metagenome]|uniref:Uncharacterized protein n=1 Tax=mine drainage metagenome TaxID=410659 RepID=A0A1J5PVP6_9ZZZZ